jgi:thioredoxin 1
MEDIKKGKVLLDFYATWCNPCKVVAKQLDVYESEVEDVKVVRINIEDPENFKVVQDYLVRSLPTLVYLEEGAVVNKSLGIKNLAQIKELTNK